ncbi:hypothetical protein [Myroides odoratus]|uniref:hypothetical protein n=1 Tax=Myroides odoratus TaxID=256 RepID=UPI0033407F8A
MVTALFSSFSSKKRRSKKNIFFVFLLIISLLGTFLCSIKGEKRETEGEKRFYFLKKREEVQFNQREKNQILGTEFFKRENNLIFSL